MKPLNILQITTHDTGRHFGCYGHPTLHTPAVDAVAADGVRLSNLFSTAPICSPARASMLTGLYPQQHGVEDLVGARGWALRDPRLHLASRLQREGWETCLAGVQHEIRKGEEERLGFDRVLQPADPGNRNAYAIAGLVKEFLAEPHARPFYLQVGFFETHTPFERGGAEPDTENGVEIPPYLVPDETSHRQMAAFQGAVRLADGGIGAIVSALRESGLEENTLLVITTDHGIEMPRAKWELFDPGLEIAMIMRCPALNLTGGRTLDQLLSAVDYLPTVMELLGLSAPDTTGRSFAAPLLGRSNDEIRDAIYALFNQRGNPRCVRTRRHKLIRYFNDFGINAAPVAWDRSMQRSVVPPVLLYDLENDPNELSSVTKQSGNRAILETLESMLWTWMEEMGDSLLQGPWTTLTYRSAVADYAAWRKGRAGALERF